MNSPIRYYGGKGTMFKEIIKHFPEPDTYEIYIEPFGGSYSIGLKKPPAKAEIYNDLEKNVYSLFKVLSNKEYFEKFKYRCDLSFYNDDIRRENLIRLKDPNISIEDRAFFFFYVNRTSHNGHGGFSMNTSIRRNMSKAVSDHLSCVDRLPELHNRLSRVIVSNMDGVKLIEKHKDRSDVLIYCDPPYEQTTRGSARYETDMDVDHYNRFLDAAIESKSKILISGYECELYNRLTDNGFEMIQFQVKTIDTKFNPKTKTETLWKNY